MRALPLFFLLFLTTGLFAQQADAPKTRYFNWGSKSVAVFCCDFTHYPPMANVEFSQEGCDYSIFADDRPHLRMLVPNESRLSLRFSLPEVPKEAVLEAVHLSSTGPNGERISPVSITVNGRTVVTDLDLGRRPPEVRWNETEWPIGDMLKRGENRIEWRAGGLRTHYWLRSVRILAAYDRPVAVSLSVPKVKNALFWEGRFSQCSYNALATVLDHFYGVEAWSEEADEFEKRTFVAALGRHGLQEYYGWGPWTNYMVRAGSMHWNGRIVDDLKSERFALRPKELPLPRGQEMIVRYGPGEQAALAEKLHSRLEQGPVIVWTPYAAAMEPGLDIWRHVRGIDENRVAVQFSPDVTHSVVVNLEDGRVKVYDNSRPGAITVVEPATVVATAAAMAGSVRIERPGSNGLLTGPLKGVERDEFNCVFWR